MDDLNLRRAEEGLGSAVSTPGVIPIVGTLPPASIQTVTSLDISSIIFPSESKTLQVSSRASTTSLLSPFSSIPSSTPSMTTTTTTPISLSSTSKSTSTSSSTPDASTTAINASIDNRTLTITLAVCFAALAIIVLFIAFLFIRQYRGGMSPFRRCSRRGATPIDDDEIATWRGNTQAMAKTPSSHVRNVSSIVFKPAEGWKMSASSPTSPPGLGEAMPFPPPVVARAPNARSGLTDEAIPGADPFVAPAQRHSRRLSKAQSTSHIRNKSRRSSVSVSSVRGRPSTSTSPWAEPEDWAVQRERSNSGIKSPTGRTSMGDDERPGGLSPRPATSTNIPPAQIPGSAL